MCMEALFRSRPETCLMEALMLMVELRVDVQQALSVAMRDDGGTLTLMP